jgi:recombinational DNA repair ATPase RecF
MQLNKIELRNFRNYEDLSLDFAPGVNLIVGDNAQGKTNLLEAISYLGSGKSFRAMKTGELIRFGADFADISGDVFSQQRQQSLRWVLFAGSRPRQIWRNGAKKKTAGEIFGVYGFAVVADLRSISRCAECVDHRWRERVDRDGRGDALRPAAAVGDDNRIAVYT